MSKVIIASILAVLVLTAVMFCLIFAQWNTQRLVLNWEIMRIRGFDYLDRDRASNAQEFLAKAKDIAQGLGNSDYRYADALGDLAEVHLAKGHLKDAKDLLLNAISILGKFSCKDQNLSGAISNDLVRRYCQLVRLEIQSQNLEKAAKNYKKVVAKIDKDSIELEPLSRRILAQTALALGDAFTAQSNGASARESYSAAEALSSSAKIRDTQFDDIARIARKKNQSFFNAAGNFSPDELLDRANKLLKQRAFSAGLALLLQAKEIANRNNDPSKTEIELAITRANFSLANYETAEASLLSLLKNTELNYTSKDEVLTRLTMIYRTCSYLEDALKVLTEQEKLREKEFGPESAKVADVNADIALTLDMLGKREQSKALCREIVKVKSLVGDADTSARFAEAQFGAGQFKQSKTMFENVVLQYQNGKRQIDHSVLAACFNLSAIAQLEGDKTESQRLLKTGQSLLPELQIPLKQVLAAESLCISAEALEREAKISDELMKAALQVLPDLPGRREGVRSWSILNKLTKYQKDHPSNFSTELKNRLEKLKLEAKKFPKPVLKGFSN